MDLADILLRARDTVSGEEALRLMEAAEEWERREQRNRFKHYFSDARHEWRGDVYPARHEYPRHLECLRAGADYRERCFMAGNRCGKSQLGAFEATAHLTGLYPDWWEGARFTRPVSVWAAGKTYETTRDIVQRELLGPIAGARASRTVSGTGMVPGERIGSVTWRQGVSDLVDVAQIRHASGGWSSLGLKAYQQGRGAFEGTAKHFIWLDEEPPADIYGECVIRTMTTGGRVLLTFTPLEGMSDVVLAFMQGQEIGG